VSDTDVFWCLAARVLYFLMISSAFLYDFYTLRRAFLWGCELLIAAPLYILRQAF
jgi:hypothetical protein